MNDKPTIGMSVFALVMVYVTVAAWLCSPAPMLVKLVFVVLAMPATAALAESLLNAGRDCTSKQQGEYLAKLDRFLEAFNADDPPSEEQTNIIAR